MNNKLLSKESLEMIYSALLTKFKSLIGKPDWEKNDKTSKDYIKNRPFYTEKAKFIEYLPKTTISGFDEKHYNYDNIFIKYIGDYGLKVSKPLVMGNKYIVTWDDVEYTATLYSEDGGHFLGMNYYYPTENPDLLPFGMWVRGDIDTLTEICAIEPGTHTFSIKVVEKEETIKKLDRKYIPSSLADWNQNDENADDYIKNRPFYIEEEKFIEYLPKTTISNFVKDDRLLYANAKVYDKQIKLNMPLEKNKKYTVNWDGVDYVATLYENEGGCHLGIWYYSGNENPESLPFGITTNFEGDALYGLNAIEPGTHTFSIRSIEKEETIKKLDKKYLPELNWKTVATSSLEVLLEETTLNYTYGVEYIENILPKIKLEEGEIFTVIWDGVVYESVVRKTEWDKAYIGNTAESGWNFPDDMATDEPFFISTWSDGEYSTVNTLKYGTHTISIYKGAFKRIDEKYIPLSITKDLSDKLQNIENDLGDLSEDALKLEWNTIETSEIAIESNLLTSSGNLKTILSEYTDAKFYNTGCSFFMSIGYPNVDAIEALVYSMTALVEISTSSSTSSTYKVYINNRMVSIDSNKQFIIIYYQNNPIILLNRENLSGAYYKYSLYLRHTGNIRVDSLTYCSNFFSGNNMRLFTAYEGNKVAWEHEVIKTPTTATEGQMLVVKEVDDNGKPIEWECVNIETNTSIILKSSTEGSTKQFRLTINDSGALTTSEIIE